MNGTIYNIQRFSTHDGPGIRTTVFFKGCNLHCLWCHNPESIPFRREVSFHRERCIGCGRCFLACPVSAHRVDAEGRHVLDRDRCTGCMRCTEVCFAEALTGIGKELSAEELVRELETDKPYYESSQGGVTFSGGECMAQVDFLAEVLQACREKGIHTAVDTAGNVPWESFEKVLAWTDLFLYDVKAADAAVHERLTGSGNVRILDNLRRLCGMGKRVIIRIPFIPEANAGEIGGIARVLEGLSVERVELLPYHRLGEGKYESLDQKIGTTHFTIPEERQILEALDILEHHGILAIRP